jgi:hypothetical protein
MQQKNEKCIPANDEIVVSQHACFIHVLFNQYYISRQREKLMLKLAAVYEQLIKDNDAMPPKELAKCFAISRKSKRAKKREVEFNMANVNKQVDNCLGNLCFITNDKNEQFQRCV